MSEPKTSTVVNLPISPVELLQNLVRFDTTNPPGNERECVSYIQRLLEQAGLETTVLSRSPSRPNLIARIKGIGQAPPLLLHGHIDVVPANAPEWLHPPFEANIIDGYLWGRGTLDMKGGIAMMITAMLRLKSEGVSPPGDVVLAVVSDEEAGGEFGTKYLVQSHREIFEGIRYAVGEFGGFSFPIAKRSFYPIMVAEKQICVLRATIRGASGHGSLRNRSSAIARLARVLGRLQRRQLPVHVTPVIKDMFRRVSASLPFPASIVFRQLMRDSTAGLVTKAMGDRGLLFSQLLRNTANPTMLRGGEQINVMPSEIDLGLDGRLLPGYKPSDLVAELKHIIGEDIELEVVHHDPGPPAPDMGMFDTLATILKEADPEGIPVPMLLPGATDGRFLARIGIQSYGFLPMKLPQEFTFAETIHGTNERITVDALAFGSEAMYQLLTRFGRAPQGPSTLSQAPWLEDAKDAFQA